MSIVAQELKLYGVQTPGWDDTSTNIGGAIDKTKKISFAALEEAYDAVSESGSDTTQTVTVTYRTAAGVVATEVKTLTGQTPVAFSATPERILKAVKSATCTGRIALMAHTAGRSNTAQAGAAGTITLDAGASGTNQYYRGWVIRTTGGTGPNQIREVINYNGTSKVATVSAVWGTTPANNTTFTVSKGLFFDKTPNEILTIHRWFMGAAADAPGGSARKFYDKAFFWNDNGSADLLTASVAEDADPSGKLAFAVEASLDGTTNNGATRQTAPGGLTFNSTLKAVANSGTLTHGTGQAVWGELTVDPGPTAVKTTYSLALTGNTI